MKKIKFCPKSRIWLITKAVMGSSPKDFPVKIFDAKERPVCQRAIRFLSKQLLHVAMTIATHSSKYRLLIVVSVDRKKTNAQSKLSFSHSQASRCALFKIYPVRLTKKDVKQKKKLAVIYRMSWDEFLKQKTIFSNSYSTWYGETGK